MMLRHTIFCAYSIKTFGIAGNHNYIESNSVHTAGKNNTNRPATRHEVSHG